MNSGGLKFDLNWGPKVKRGDPSTTACLTVFIDGEAVWPLDGTPEVGLDIQVDDLLAYLSEFWKPLVLRQTYPIAVIPDRPSHLRAVAESRWESQPSELVEREDESVCNFEDAHNLARCFAGMFDLPPLWLLRTNDRLIVDTQSKLRTVLFQQAYAEFSRIGDEISAHLSHKSERWVKLVQGWNARDVGSPKILLAWSTNLDKEIAWQFAAEGILSAPANVAEAANDDDELRIAARMASALPTDQIRKILNLVRSFEHHKAPKLDELGTSVSNHVNENFAHSRAHEQGEAAASFVRQHLAFSSNTYVNIFDVVEALGTGLYEEDVEPDTLDALAVWGGKFGPAVLLNSNSRRATKGVNVREDLAARVTLAHELCHLLLDRGHALGAVDVLNSKMPRAVESRAKSFAGELLLPSNVAAEVWVAAQSPESLEGLSATIKTLQESYGVSKSVATWKLDHGLQQRNIDLTVLLDTIAPYR